LPTVANKFKDHRHAVALKDSKLRSRAIEASAGNSVLPGEVPGDEGVGGFEFSV